MIQRFACGACWLLQMCYSLASVACFLTSQIAASCLKNEFPSAVGLCYPMLGCDQLTSLRLGEKLEGGYVKSLWKASVAHTDVVYAVPSSDLVKKDFLHGMTMVKDLQSDFVAKLVGYCDNAHFPQMAILYYKYGSARLLSEVLDTLQLSELDKFRLRLQISVDYINIIAFLHSSPVGTRVMCDANDLDKTLSQFLVTDEMRLVVADLDALPRVDRAKGRLVKCGHREISGSFAAPEQLWPYEGEEFSDDKMPGYDEKIDIWKIPDVIVYLLGESSHAERLKVQLFEVFLSCKYIDAKSRPSAGVVLAAFQLAKDSFNSKQDL